MSASADYVTVLPREHQETRGKIRTFTGRYVNPLKLRARDICIEDIAHHLSLVCRYTGACPYHYSVAQHSVLVSADLLAYTGSRVMGLAGLLHDASEAYLNDIASPVKHSPQFAWYRKLDEDVTRMIYRVFGLDDALLAKTKAADDRAFFLEARTWWGGETAIFERTPRAAEAAFLQLFRELGGKSIL